MQHTYTYRALALDECERINEINPAQYIKRAWREVDGQRQLVEIDYHENSWPDGYEHYLSKLKQTIQDNGYAVGAFDENGKLIGFGTVNRDMFGIKYKHVLLDSLFTSLEHRNKGIGKKLFLNCANMAQKWGVDKIYICAGSAEDTIAFYYALGCKEAEEIKTELYESDPRDMQLEYLIK
ncbi:GNAT family N-acetyltransferase [Paenibacillus sp. SC116]|uniref:GNAT family N-acetyltransferase n=1 Tax=Paenibacillus sp. SC116 TaxID=2968986 RepID=UPI00215A2FF5|nr:GNAT family N-acetyltransferase [Paenibacillus sp. SC116]MCR8842637.1 GNAT family N-acetyltransferase [Paenibacillus sp. SC116]